MEAMPLRSAIAKVAVLSLALLALCGCALLMPKKYGPDEANVRPLWIEDREMVESWSGLLDDKKAFKKFEAELKQLKRERNDDEVVRRVSLYLHAYPVMKLGVFDADARVRYGKMIMIYADSLIAEGLIEEAGKVLQHARSVLPLHPGIRYQTRRVVRIHRRDLLYGRYHLYFKNLPDPEPELIELMEQARREDSVLPPTHELFGHDNVKLGQWQSDFFSRTYGSALFWSETFDGSRIPVILVHGVNGSPQVFERLVARFEGSPYQPAYFFYPTGMPLDEASESLAESIRTIIRRHGVTDLAVVAHSMGGLVAKGVLDREREGGELKPWKLFVSISTPWTGFEGAHRIENMPHHPPSLRDMSPKLDFIKRAHHTPIPKGVGFYIFFGARGAGGETRLSDGNDDAVVSLQSVLESPVSEMAVDIFGFYETHTSILGSERMYRRLSSILDSELSGD
jgi:pimeloyl-ACP methyl ester carboxylesterase